MASVRIGVFGVWRGETYVRIMSNEPDVEIVCLCDKNKERLDAMEKYVSCPRFTDFDEFLEYGKAHGMNAVFLANYFNQHTPFAVRCLEAGMDVISECTAASTLAECVQLVEAVERTGRKFMLAENYPFSAANTRMNEIVKSGELGRLLYAEGEYNHTGSPEMLKRLTTDLNHWRGWLPRTYYITHALGPVMYMTGTMPKYVSGRAAHSDLLYELRDFRHNFDGAGMAFMEMDNGMIVRVTGCTAMASDYSRYRVVGDRAGVEAGGYIGGGKVRTFWHGHTKPEDEPSNVRTEDADFSKYGEKGAAAAKASHGGGDYWVVQNMIGYFRDGVDPFFDVYRSVAMSEVGILAWRSALHHGKNIKIPDFRKKSVRDRYRDDRETPFPDGEGNGATLPAALPWKE